MSLFYLFIKLCLGILDITLTIVLIALPLILLGGVIYCLLKGFLFVKDPIRSLAAEVKQLIEGAAGHKIPKPLPVVPRVPEIKPEEVFKKTPSELDNLNTSSDEPGEEDEKEATVSDEDLLNAISDGGVNPFTHLSDEDLEALNN